MDNKISFRKKYQFDIYTIAKLVVVACIIIYVACLLIFTSGSTKSFAEVAGPVDGIVNKRRMVKAKDREIKKMYGLNTSEYEGILCYMAKNNLSSEEIIIVKVKDESQVKDVKDAIYKRIESRKSVFQGYAPDEEKYLEDAIVSTRGKFVFMAVGPDSEQLKDMFYDKL